MRNCRQYISALLAVIITIWASPVLAGQCRTPVNLTPNGGFDDPKVTTTIGGYTNSTNWVHNSIQAQSFPVFATHPAVETSPPPHVPTGADAAAYPVETLNSFTLSQLDNIQANLTLPTNTANSLYVNGQLHIWYDVSWRHSGGASRTASLKVNVNGATYMDIQTVAGTAAGNATIVLSGGATLGGTAPPLYNAGGGGTFGRWYTVHLIVPYTSSTIPTVTFNMSAVGSEVDDFSLDRIYVPMCRDAALRTVKTLTSADATPDEGDTVTFGITVTNSGPSTATNVTMTDLLPAGLTATAGNGVPTLGAYTAGTGLWTIPSLTNGQSATLTMQGTVDTGRAGQTITNLIPSAALGDQRDTSTTGDDLSESVTVSVPQLAVSKTSAIYNSSFFLPQNDVLYAINVKNTGGGSVDNNSLFVIDSLPAQVEFYNNPTAELGGQRVGWSQSATSLTFNASTNVAFSDQVTKPASFSQCSYSPVSGYDPAIRHVCFQPSGSMLSGNPDPEFTLTFRARVK
ncbi:MAG: DUF11 domain-containing protein [Sphingomonadaceae bacterium]